MTKALHTSAEQTHKRTAEDIDWRKKISDHVAYGLLAYTGLQIFVTMTVLKTNHTTILPYFALVALVFAIIPGCRLFEKRWTDLSDAQASDPGLAGRCKRDCTIIWVTAIGLPLVLTALFKALASLFA